MYGLSRSCVVLPRFARRSLCYKDTLILGVGLLPLYGRGLATLWGSWACYLPVRGTLAVLTAHTQRTRHVDVVHAAHAGLLGISRTARAEEGLSVGTIDNGCTSEVATSALGHLLSSSGSELELAAAHVQVRALGFDCAGKLVSE